MTDIVEVSRRFRVRMRHAEDHHGHILSGASFEAAAVAYLEHHPAVADENGEARVIVHDVDDGFEHCFRIDLQTGSVLP
jgi:hypothetical protein